MATIRRLVLAGCLLLLGFVAAGSSANASSDIVSLGWGNNSERQLTNSKDQLILLPETVGRSSDVSQQSITRIETDSLHGCAVTEEGEVVCWGDNSFGQLGREPLEPSVAAGRPIGLGVSIGLPITDVAVGDKHSCALGADGEVYCWGRNQFGQTGAAPESDLWQPSKVIGFAPGEAMTQLALGDGYSCSLSETGVAYCWGRNANGQLGQEDRSSTPVPQRVEGLPQEVTFTNISAGARHACGTGTDGVAYCWGMNAFGQVGVDPQERSDVPTPTAVALPPEAGSVRSVTAGRWHSCANTDTGAVYCWGHNQFGQLGNGTQENSFTPVAVQGDVAGVPQSGVSAGGSHTCSWGIGADVYCWGSNEHGQLGDGTQTSHLTSVRTGSGDTDRAERPVLSVSAGKDSTVALYGYSTRPGVPQSLTFAGTSLAWTAPLYPGLGDGALSQYRIAMYPPGETRPTTYATVPATTTSMDLAGDCPAFSICSSKVGIDPGQTYRWSVSAVGGDGGASAASRLASGTWQATAKPPVETPGTQPSSPFIVGLDGTNLSWTAPDFSGVIPANLAMYSIRISVSGEGTPREYMSIPASATSVDLAGPCPVGGVCKRPIAPLVSGVGYDMRVYAVGANGAASTWPRGVESSYFVWP